MSRTLLIVILLLILLMVSLFATSAQARWSMWVYQPADGGMLRVDNAGQVINTAQIPAITTSVYPNTIIIDPNGTQVAYVMPNRQTIRIIGLDNSNILAEIGLSEIGIAYNNEDELYLSQVAFSEDGNRLVYGEILAGFGWQIHVYDIPSVSIIQTLTFGDASAGQYPALHGGIRPVINHITGDRVTFTVDVDFPVQIHSYHWFYQGDILSETVAAQSLIVSGFPYGADIVNAVHDYRFPADNDDFRWQWEQVNTLHAYHFNQGRYPIYFAPDLSLQDIWFVQGGERLLVSAYVNEIVDVWVLIERDGNEIRRYPSAGYDTTGTPDGYIYATTVEDQTAIVSVDTRNSTSAGSTLWIQPGDWRIMWAGSNRPANALQDWAQLAQSAQDPTGIVSRYATPTQAPLNDPYRFIGQEIQIYVPEEGYLNLRDAPTTNSNVITLLESGTRGTIIDGPVSAEGFIWWQISIANRTGWVVEELPDSIALIPPQIIPSVTPTGSVTPTP